MCIHFSNIIRNLRVLMLYPMSPAHPAIPNVIILHDVSKSITARKIILTWCNWLTFKYLWKCYHVLSINFYWSRTTSRFPSISSCLLALHKYKLFCPKITHFLIKPYEIYMFGEVTGDMSQCKMTSGFWVFSICSSIAHCMRWDLYSSGHWKWYQR